MLMVRYCTVDGLGVTYIFSNNFCEGNGFSILFWQKPRPMLWNHKRNSVFSFQGNCKKHVVMKNISVNQIWLLHFFETQLIGFHSSQKILQRVLGIFVIHNQRSDSIDHFIIKNEFLLLVKIANCMKNFHVMKQWNSFCMTLHKVSIRRFKFIRKPRRNEENFMSCMNAQTDSFIQI